MKSGLRLLLCVFGLFSWSGPGAAWESDVHYGLTRWLALKAGFSAEQAQLIAGANQGVDASPITDPIHATISSACTGADTTGSSEVHDHHFPSKNGVPDSPSERFVKPGLVQRQGAVSHAPLLSAKPATFNDFGKYLHALQDTWSHQGIPDFPDPPCDPQLGWGHAFSREGWACHLADLTYKWQDQDVPEMAKATYDEMAAQTTGQAETWNHLVAAVAEFAAARSKWEKHDWFRKQGFADQDLGFLQEISLPDCAADAPGCPGPYPFQQLIDAWLKYVRPLASLRVVGGGMTIPTTTVPSDIAQLFNNFIRGLLAGGVMVKTGLVDYGLSRIALTRSLHLGKACPEFVDELQEKMLGPSFMAGWAAHQPIELCEAAYQASKAGSGEISCDAAADALRQFRILRYGPNISELAPAAEARALPIFILTTSFVPRSESYFGFVRFIHLPRDVLVLGARRISGTAKIISAVWAPDQ